MKKATIIGSAVLLVAVMAWPVLAQGPGYGRGGYGMGPGYGPGMMHGWGPGMRQGWGPGMGPGSGPGWANLSEEDAKKLEDARQKFYEETKDLVQQIRIKRAELRALMINPASPDEDIISKHKELKELTNQMSEKRLAQRLELRKQFPDLADDFGGGWGQGCGRGGWGRGHGYGRGGYGGGRGQGGCWY